MASSGSAAWAKYFQGKGDIPTTLKKASVVFDFNDQNKRLGELPAGTQIVYLQSATYSTKPAIQYKNKPTDRKLTVARVSFDSIAKPGVKSSGAVSLKPQSFNVKDRKYPVALYKSTVKEAIEEHQKLSGNLKTYLSMLFDYYSNGTTTKQAVTSFFNKVKGNLPINDINKDFGEVLGPVALAIKGVVNKRGLKFTPAAQVYVPERPNEPLMDYALYQGNKTFIISAKSGTTTNVVKPGDIISLINRDPAKVKKWKNTNEYKVLNILADNNIIIGPIKAVAFLYPDLITPKAVENLSFVYNKNHFRKFIASNEYLSKKSDPTLNEIMYECEKILQKESKTGVTLNMNDIMADAISGIVYYIKFELDDHGIGEWKWMDETNIRTFGRVYLRTKNGYTRASDRMGIQV